MYSLKSLFGTRIKFVCMYICKSTKVRSVVRLRSNQDPALRIVRWFEEQAARMGRRSILKEAAKCAEELGLKLD